MNKIYLRNPATDEGHIVTIHESGSEIMDAVLDQFNLSSMEIIDESRYHPAAKMETLDLCDPRDSSKIIGTLETTFLGLPHAGGEIH
jgi:hypothetical protein